MILSAVILPTGFRSQVTLDQAVMVAVTLLVYLLSLPSPCLLPIIISIGFSFSTSSFTRPFLTTSFPFSYLLCSSLPISSALPFLSISSLLFLPPMSSPSTSPFQISFSNFLPHLCFPSLLALAVNYSSC